MFYLGVKPSSADSRYNNNLILMKRLFLFKLVLPVFILLFAEVSVVACEIGFKVGEKFQKEAYSAGEELVVEQKVMLIHRHCSVDIGETKTQASGCEIIGTTKWVETAPGVFERKLKVKILESGNSPISITCTRSCDKDGGSGKITLKRKV